MRPEPPPIREDSWAERAWRFMVGAKRKRLSPAPHHCPADGHIQRCDECGAEFPMPKREPISHIILRAALWMGAMALAWWMIGDTIGGIVSEELADDGADAMLEALREAGYDVP